jgi:hypothetical protein
VGSCSPGIGERILFDLVEQLFDRLLGQSMGFFTKGRSGDLLAPGQ